MVPFKGNLNATTHNDILDVLQTSWQQFGEGPFLFPHKEALMYKVRPTKKLFSQFDVEQLQPQPRPTPLG